MNSDPEMQLKEQRNADIVSRLRCFGIDYPQMFFTINRIIFDPRIKQEQLDAFAEILRAHDIEVECEYP